MVALETSSLVAGTPKSPWIVSAVVRFADAEEFWASETEAPVRFKGATAVGVSNSPWMELDNLPKSAAVTLVSAFAARAAWKQQAKKAL
jgi:hypothetical protein